MEKLLAALDAALDQTELALAQENNEPADLKPNTKVKIIAPTGRGAAGLAADFAYLSEPVFKKIWDHPLDADYDAL